jgi:hypothetical protein
MNQIKLHLTKVLTLLCVLAIGINAQATELDTTKIHSAILKPGEIQEGILVFEDEAGDWKIWYDHRMYWDAGVYFTGDENPMSNGMQLRRGIIQFKTTMYRDWEAYIDLNAGRGSGATPRDFWLKRYVRTPNWTLEFQVGNFKETTSLERLTSSRMLTFMERSGDSVFEEGRRKGAACDISTPRKFWTEWGVHGQEVDENRFEDGDNEAFGFNGRVVYTPVQKDRTNPPFGCLGFDPAAGCQQRRQGTPENPSGNTDHQQR